MALNVITDPAIEPIKLADLKNDIRVDGDLTEDDFLIAGQLTAARRWVEKKLSRALISQTLEITLDAWPKGDRGNRGDCLEIPRPPLQSITSIKYYDTDHTEYTMSSDDYFVDTASSPGRVVLNYGATWPSGTLRPVNGVVVRFVAGYGDEEDDVPEHMVQALRLLVGHWYEHRKAIEATGAIPKEVPLGVAALLWPDRVMTF